MPVPGAGMMARPRKCASPRCRGAMGRAVTHAPIGRGLDLSAVHPHTSFAHLASRKIQGGALGFPGNSQTCESNFPPVGEGVLFNLLPAVLVALRAAAQMNECMNLVLASVLSNSAPFLPL